VADCPWLASVSVFFSALTPTETEGSHTKCARSASLIN